VKKHQKKPRKARHSATEYFVAFLGLALVVFVVGVIATSDSCRVQPSPDLGVQPAVPATPTR
jgi:hypothetical protein